MNHQRLVDGPIVLIILDGWGLANPSPGNAVELAKTPVFDRLWHDCPHTTLKTSGIDVGLRDGQIGNSEVGHLNIGAGFIVNQAIRQIDVTIEDGTFLSNPALLAAMRDARERGRPVHIMGLLSDAGVHAHTDHLLALLELARLEKLPDVAVHAFLDGRDTSPTSGADYLAELIAACDSKGIGRIASIIGRYYAMDRDNRWERIRLAFDLLVHGVGERTRNPDMAVREHYQHGTTDEFMPAIVVEHGDGRTTTIEEGDSVVFLNYRADRARQITQALVGPDVAGEDFSDRPGNLVYVGMMPYAPYLNIQAAFEPVSVVNPLARIVSEAGLRQFHTAETEKYAHVTYFINGGREEAFPGEVREMAQSPKVATYDLQPEMSASKVADAAVRAIADDGFEIVILNFANPDMVGHTGVIEAAVVACETVDRALSRIIDAVRFRSGAALIIADHGNAEQMLVPGTSSPMTAHTTNLVPCILVGDSFSSASLRDGGRLADVAPTLLEMLGLQPSAEMTGQSLIVSG